MQKEFSYNKKVLDKEGFEELFRFYFTGLCLFAAKFVKDKDTSKEIVHDIFIKLWENRLTIDSSKTLKPYLFTSVHNRCLNYIRDHKKFQTNTEISNLTDYFYSESSDIMIELEIKEKIQSTVNSLPEKCREIFEMNRYEGYKYNEIAEKLGISVKTVENQISKALKILRENLIEYLTLVLVLLKIFLKK